jgi:bacterioferritin
MQGKQDIIDLLNTLLAGELTAVDQYLLHGEMYADMGLQKLAEKALHESAHEREHAQAITQCEQAEDYVSREMLVVQLDDTEMDHAYFLEKQLRLIELTGLPNYLQSQMA